MALAATAELADGAYPDQSQEVGVAPTREERQAGAEFVRTVGWAAAVLAAVAVVGLVVARSLLLLWIVLLVLAVAALPQTLGIARRGQAQERERHSTDPVRARRRWLNIAGGIAAPVGVVGFVLSRRSPFCGRS